MNTNPSLSSTPLDPGSMSYFVQRARNEDNTLPSDEEYSSDFEPGSSDVYTSEAGSSDTEAEIPSSAVEEDESSGGESSIQSYNENKAKWYHHRGSVLLKPLIIEKTMMVARFALIAIMAESWKQEEYPILTLSAIFFVIFGYAEKKAQEKIFNVYQEKIQPPEFYAEELD